MYNMKTSLLILCFSLFSLLGFSQQKYDKLPKIIHSYPQKIIGKTFVLSSEISSDAKNSFYTNLNEAFTEKNNFIQNTDTLKEQYFILKNIHSYPEKKYSNNFILEFENLNNNYTIFFTIDSQNIKSFPFYLSDIDYAEIFSDIDEPIHFTEIIKQEGKNKTELYTIIKSWIATSFVSANEVIQMDDPQNGILICQAAYHYYYPSSKIKYENLKGYIHYTLKIQVKDNRYKVDINNFSHKALNHLWSLGPISNREKYKDGAPYEIMNNAWKNIQLISEIEFKKITSELKNATSGKLPIIDLDDDW